MVNREIEPGYLFSESDFLQPGTLITSIKAYEAIDEGEFIPEDSGSDWTGRVAARDLEAGETLKEDDLFPAGTSPGVTAAIPSDRVALEIELDQVRGAKQLARGDRFDLLCTVTSDIGNALAGVQVSPVLLSNLENARSNRLLAKRAIVIERIEDQIIVAFHANEISEITKSLASNEDIYCITRSANDDDAEDDSKNGRSKNSDLTLHTVGNYTTPYQLNTLLAKAKEERDDFMIFDRILFCSRTLIKHESRIFSEEEIMKSRQNDRTTATSTR